MSKSSLEPAVTSGQPALTYSRVSTARQAREGHGLDSQETRSRDHAVSIGCYVEAAFSDDASGGGDFMKRPGMVALLSYLDDHSDKNYVVIFDDLKRFCARYRVSYPAATGTQQEKRACPVPEFQI
jgi:DNA invertase Pin-like site-specific DNA recombinase